MLRRRYNRGFSIADGGLPTPAHFPLSITPAIWLDGSRQAYSDIAGTVPTTAGGRLGLIVEGAPLTSDWRAPDVGSLARRDSGAVRFDYCGPGLASSQSLTHTSTVAIDTTNCTLAASFRARDASQAPQQGLLRCAGFGLYASNGWIAITYNNVSANWGAIAIPTWTKGARVTVVVRVTSTGIRARVLIDGVLYNDALVAAISGTPTAAQFQIGATNGADTGFYGSISHALVVARPISDAETVELSTWLDAQPLDVGFPTSQTLFAVIGDSIMRGVSGGYSYQHCPWKALQNIRGAYPNCELLNAAVGGSGVEIGMYTPVIPYYSAQRSRNVLVVACGTNTLATNNGQVYCRDTLFATCDTARAAGWRLALATILDRTASLSLSQAAFDSQRAFVNAAILGSVGVHCDAVIDMTNVPLMSANGAANSATYFGDQIHPTAAGHALMEPVYRAAMLALAA